MSTQQIQNNPFELINQRFDQVEMLLAKLLESKSVKLEGKKYLDVHEAAKYVGLSTQSVYRLSSEGTIPCIKKHKKLLFLEGELSEWLETGRKV
jgi:excisionase family DNA binding protein